MSATCVPASVRMFQIEITFDTSPDALRPDWCRVVSLGSQRKEITVDLTGLPDDVLTATEASLFDRLASGVSGRRGTISEPDAIMWREMRRKADTYRATVSPAKEITHVSAILIPSEPAVTATPASEIAPVADIPAAATPVVDVAARESNRLASEIGARAKRRHWSLLDSPNVEDRIAGFLKVEGELKGREYWVVRYDIPKVLTDAGICPSPCAFLRALGCVHTDGSGWHATLDTLRSPGFVDWVEATRAGWKRFAEMHRRMREDGLTGALSEQQIMNLISRSKPLVCRVEPLDKRLNANILRDVIESLDSCVREAHTKLIETIARADEALAEATKGVKDDETGVMQAPTHEQRKEAEKERIATVRSAINEACTTFGHAIKGAEKFDATMDVQDLLDALKSAIRAQSQAFNVRYQSTRTDRGGYVKPAPTVS